MSFITKIEKEYPDFTILHLADGRVIGVTPDCVVLYDNYDDIWEGEYKQRPMINLHVEEEANDR